MARVVERPPVSERLQAIKNTFPEARSLVITSPRDLHYNCIAHALGIRDAVWWPLGSGDLRWLPGWPRVLTVDNVEGVFVGFERCANGIPEPGFEKIAIYAKNKKPTHAARQLESGRWTSKLGPDEDVEHDLADLMGRRYGQPVVFLRRPWPASLPQGTGR